MLVQDFTRQWQDRVSFRSPEKPGLILALVAKVFLIVIGFAASARAMAADRAPAYRELVAPEITAEGITEVAFQTIAKGSRSGVRTPRQVVARNQTEWNHLWGQHSSIGATSPLPVIDFEKDIVVGLFLGDKPTGGYGVAIIRAEQRDGNLTAYFEEKFPRPGGILLQSLTQPFHIVRVARANYSNVIFRRVS